MGKETSSPSPGEASVSAERGVPRHPWMHPLNAIFPPLTFEAQGMHAGLCLERAALHLSQMGPGLEREDFSESFMVLEWSASSVCLLPPLPLLG